MNIESTIIQSVTTDLIDTTDIPPLIVDEDNAYDDIYVGKEVRVSQTLNLLILYNHVIRGPSLNVSVRLLRRSLHEMNWFSST